VERGLRQWVSAVGQQWGARAENSLRDALQLAHVGSAIDSHRIGYRVSERGHSIDELLGWFAWLQQHQPRISRKVLGREHSTVALSSGWAAATLAADDDHAVSLEVLRLRLHQHFQLATQLGVPPDAHVAVVVVQCLGDATSDSGQIPHEVTDLARTVFVRGETVASTGAGNVLILAQRNAELPLRVQRLGDLLRAEPVLAAWTVRVWVEPIGSNRDLLDSYLGDLAGASAPR
jgi:hypothetical protein